MLLFLSMPDQFLNKYMQGGTPVEMLELEAVLPIDYAPEGVT